MWKINQSYVNKVKETLTELGGICPRCILRCAGMKNSKIIREAGLEETSEEKLEPETKKVKLNPCRLCIGLLEERYMDSAFESICNALKENYYDEDHYTIAISLPVSLSLRNHSICLFLNQKHEDFDEDEIIPIKQVWKWLFPQRLEERLKKKFVTGNNCQFYIELQLNFENDDKELEQLQNMCQDEYSKRAKNQKKYHMGLVTRVGLEKSLENVPKKDFEKHYAVPPEEPNSILSWNVALKHDSCFIAGRYNKYSRELPQTPWILDGKKIFETSVEDLISSKIKEKLIIDDSKFSSSGREDVDVRMLGRGRPFLLEMVNPRKVHLTRDELDDIQSNINESTNDIYIRDLQIVPKSSISNLKEGEDQKRKIYTALCVVSKEISIETLKEKLEPIQNLELSQWTPIRVLHRRPDAKRMRTVYYMEVSAPISNVQYVNADTHNLFLLKLATQAGTYVKEFVHGDFDRTVPNVSQIVGCDVDIIALDVEEIVLDWPPRL